MKSKFLQITLLLIVGALMPIYAVPPPPPPGLPIDGGVGFLFAIAMFLGLKKIIKK